jgi:hypothetical protein
LTPLPWWPILVALWLENCRTVLLLEGRKKVSRAAPVGRFDGPLIRFGAIIGNARRRCPEAREECWHVYYDDVHVGTIRLRSGVPVYQDQWSWSLGFYPVSHRGEDGAGTAATFEQARRNFETAWRGLQPNLS